MVDLGSNSVRLVVFEGSGRSPVAIFNEKAVLRLGRGLQTTGRLQADGIAQTLTVMERYVSVARAMGAYPFDVLATAAVREATNGPDFVATLKARFTGIRIRTLTGEQEAALSAEGLLCGIPDAHGILADIGGGSLELVQMSHGNAGTARTLRLGVIRLAERAGGDMLRARTLVEEDLATVPFLGDILEGDLYLVGGAWRALARMHIGATAYPLNIVHHYCIERDAARDLAATILGAARRTLERMPGVPRRRVDDIPLAALVLRCLLRGTSPKRVVFSANGLREGWYMQQISLESRRQDGLLTAAQDFAAQLGRDPTLPPALLTWTDPLFASETLAQRRLREAACWFSDSGSHDHPEYRAEQAFLRVLRQPGVGIDHTTRVFLALVTALRYEAEPNAPFLVPLLPLLQAEQVRRAAVLGYALRLAYTLSAGTQDLLAATRLVVADSLVLRLAAGTGVFSGESVTRRLDRLASEMGLPATTEVAN